MTKDEALDLALEALEAGEYYINDLEAIVYAADDLGTDEDRTKMQEAITAIKQARSAPVQEPVMVNMSPPATQRDRWMYEQGRLAERDPRTHADIAWGLAEKVRRDLDRQSCPGVYMNLAMESIVKHYTTPPAQPAPVPDAIGPNEDELPAYAAGWNDCRQAMMEMKK